VLDWYAQNYRDNQAQGRPATFSSARAALEAANNNLQALIAEEVIVYHRLYSDQAFLRVSSAIDVEEVSLQAAVLEQHVRRAAHGG
jgi:hypothetical protein